MVRITISHFKYNKSLFGAIVLQNRPYSAKAIAVLADLNAIVLNIGHVTRHFQLG